MLLLHSICLIFYHRQSSSILILLSITFAGKTEDTSRDKTVLKNSYDAKNIAP